MDDARYPIGPFISPTTLTRADRDSWIAVLEAAPETYRRAVSGLNDAELDTPYREGGWTVRQLIPALRQSAEQVEHDGVVAIPRV